MSSQNLNSIIQQFQNQKASIDAELQKLTTELAVMENNLSNHLNLAQEKFGTTDINVLNTILTNLTVESEALSNELNALNQNPNQQMYAQPSRTGVNPNQVV